MNTCFKYGFIFFLTLLRFFSFSQYEASKWYFGNHAGLDFMTNPPTALTNGSLSTQEGCAAISSPAGNLLFYTDGSTIYNQLHVAMANGTGLNGNSSTTQAAVIIKQPGSSTIYYVITLGVSGTGPLCYSTVDMSLASGNGSVTVKNFTLATVMSEKLTAAKHCNGVDFWVLSHENFSNNFKCFLITAAGVSTTAVISSCGTVYSSIDYDGYLKLSPTGKKIGVAMESTGFQIFDFDSSTGIVSNSLSLGTGFSNAYGCEFSPDGTKFYGDRESGSLSLYQWDLCAGSPTAIVASLVTMTVASQIMAMQLAIDGKIYITRSGQQTLGVINNPNALGAACSYSHTGQSIAPKTGNLGLPNFLTSYFSPPPPPFTSTVNVLYGCQTASFNSSYTPSVITIGCTATTNSISALMWNFGDPASGITNTSTLTNPSHQFSSVGTYTVNLILYYNCRNDTLTGTVTVTLPCITVIPTSITCSSLGSATATSQSPGVFSYTWMPTAQTTSAVTGLSPGTYTLTVHNSANNITYTATATLPPLVPLTGNLDNSSSVNCNSAATATAVIYNLAGGSGSQTYLWTNGVSTYTTAQVNTLSAGLWSVTVTDALTSCQINRQFFISQPSPVVVTPSASTPSACVGHSITLTGTASGGVPASVNPNYTYSWTAGASGTLQTVSNNLAGIYVYTLNAADSLACSSSQTIALNFVQNPTLSVSDVSICPFQTATLTASGAGTYTWSSGSTGSIFTANPVANQQYTVTGGLSGCSSFTTANVILLPVPTPVTSNNSPVCQGDALSLNASGGMIYSWHGPGGFVSLQPNPVLTPVSLSASGVYTVVVTAINSCTAAASETASIKPLPALTISPASSSICVNTTSVTLSAAGTATSFSWQPNQNISSVTMATVLAYPGSSQVYTLTGSLNSCTALATATISVVAPPSPSISLSSATTCAQSFNGSPNTITLTALGANIYTISTATGIFNSNPGGPVTSLSAMPPYLSGMSTATLYGSNGVCTMSTTAFFTIIPNPTVSVNNPTPVICAGESFTYTSAGASSYTWSSGTPGQTLYTTGNAAVADPGISSVFLVSGSSSGCNSATQSTTLTVNPLPVVSVQPDPAVMCLNSPVTLTASGTGTLYNWQPFSWLSSSQGATVSANPPAQQNYTVVASLSNCTASAMVTVLVLPLPEPVITCSNPQNLLCLSQSFTLYGSGGVGYSWEYPNQLAASGPSVQIIPVNVSYSGNYTMTTTGTNGCINSSVLTMTIEDSPTGYLGGSRQQGCVPFCGDYHFIASNFPQSDISVNSWQINNQTVLQNAQDAFQYCFTRPGDYFIKGNLISTHGCTNTVTFSVSAYPLPVADFSFTPQAPVENFDQVNFTPVGQQPVTEYGWYFASNDPHDQSAAVNPGHVFESAGVYPVALIVKNQWGCIDSIVKTITVEPDFEIYVPNAFTPNADGKNELFYPVSRGVQIIQFTIYDRWGEKLFSTTDPAAGWDGTFQGKPCKEDSYVWKMDATGKNSQNKKLSGLVTLYR